MSNYLLLVSRGAMTERVRAWVIARKKDETELITRDLDGGVTLTYVARQASDNLVGDSNVIFQGYEVVHADRAIRFGAGGYREALNARRGSLDALLRFKGEGCFVRISWNAKELLVERDLFGVCPALYTAAEDLVAVSDSPFALAKLRSDLGLSRTLDWRSAVARSWTNSMGGQLLSSRTIVREIRYMPFNVTLRVALTELIASELPDSVHSAFPQRAGSYREQLAEAAVQLASVIATLASAAPAGIRMSLSGGLDSRVCLAAGLLSPGMREQMEFSSANRTEAQKRDYAVVRALAEKRRFKLGHRGNVDPRPSDRPRGLPLWLVANVGMYDYVVLPGKWEAHDVPVAIGGHGAEVYKGNYGWRRIRSIAGLIPDKLVANAFFDEAADALVSLGVDALDPHGSEWHYLAYRNAIHGGRFVQSSMLGARPLMMAQMVSLSRSPDNPFPAPKKYEPSIVSDLLICMDKTLAEMPFDDSKKGMSAEYVRTRAAELTPVTAADIVPYAVVGTAADAQKGPSDLVVGLADAWQSRLATSRGRQDLVSETWASVADPELQRLYGGLRTALEDGQTMLRPVDPAMRSAFGKILQFSLLGRNL